MARLRTGENKREARQAARRLPGSLAVLHAVGDWRRVAARAKEMGREDLIEKFQLKDSYGWKSIDKCTERFKAALATEGDGMEQNTSRPRMVDMPS